MHSTLKPEDPFNLSHCTGVHAHTLNVEDFIYMLNQIRFLRNVFTVDSYDD